MTFEEFFRKKKIDLDLLKQADSNLFVEFKSHYEQMGEKSFDHSKKFWFNKLRRNYPLKEVHRIEKELIKDEKITSSVEETSVGQKQITDTTEKQPVPVYQPRFKPKNIPVKPTIESEPIPTNSNEEVKPETSNSISAVEEASQQKEVKPVYKPRFNMKSIKPGPEK